MLVELNPIKEHPSDYDEIEARIIQLLRSEIYEPLAKELRNSPEAILNASESLLSAIKSGRISFSKGKFSGSLNATLSKSLKAIGAKWRSGGFFLPTSKLPLEVRDALAVAERKLEASFIRIDRKLKELVPAKIADKLSLNKLFDRVLWRTDESFKDTIRGITVAPALTPERRAKIAEEYTENMQLYIRDWTEKEIVTLRQKMQKNWEDGLRYDEMVKTIQRSYGVSRSKAKFLARQETSLLIAKFKKSRYTDAGVNKYRWGCVAGSKNHPVRSMHKALEGKTFTWDNPPVTDDKGNRNNPGEDYNCRCFARPLVNF